MFYYYYDMASISVDRNKCIGCRLCENSCPECFEIGVDGIAKVIATECKSCNLEEVAASCPVEAITVKNKWS